ncbi:MAG: hypothetical protein IT190_07085 [Microbacteriaceae bacterium]|nr:hypothetical protein [Microbacteriaceae bacterium]
MPAQSPSRQYPPGQSPQGQYFWHQWQRSLAAVAIGLLAGTLVACTPAAPDASVTEPPGGGATAEPVAAEVLVVTFHTPAEFEIHGGHCVLDAGDLIVDASSKYLPDGYLPPPANNPGASLTIYKNPTSPPTHGTAGYSIDGAEHWGPSNIVIAPDLLSGTFTFDDGAAGEWRCAKIETPEEALAGS